jgi:hypothetical protein
VHITRVVREGSSLSELSRGGLPRPDVPPGPLLRIESSEGELLVELDREGKLKAGKGYDPDKTAAWYWHSWPGERRPLQPGDVMFQAADEDGISVQLPFKKRIKYGKHYTPSEQAKLFWKALAANHPFPEAT